MLTWQLWQQSPWAQADPDVNLQVAASQHLLLHSCVKQRGTDKKVGTPRKLSPARMFSILRSVRSVLQPVQLTQNSALPLVCHSHTALLRPAGHCHIHGCRSHLTVRAGSSDTRLLHGWSASQSLCHCRCWRWWNRYKATRGNTIRSIHSWSSFPKDSN